MPDTMYDWRGGRLGCVRRLRGGELQRCLHGVFWAEHQVRTQTNFDEMKTNQPTPNLQPDVAPQKLPTFR